MSLHLLLHKTGLAISVLPTYFKRKGKKRKKYMLSVNSVPGRKLTYLYLLESSQ